VSEGGGSVKAVRGLHLARLGEGFGGISEEKSVGKRAVKHLKRPQTFKV